MHTFFPTEYFSHNLTCGTHTYTALQGVAGDVARSVLECILVFEDRSGALREFKDDNVTCLRASPLVRPPAHSAIAFWPMRRRVFRPGGDPVSSRAPTFRSQGTYIQTCLFPLLKKHHKFGDQTQGSAIKHTRKFGVQNEGRIGKGIHQTMAASGMGLASLGVLGVGAASVLGLVGFGVVSLLGLGGGIGAA